MVKTSASRHSQHTNHLSHILYTLLHWPPLRMHRETSAFPSSTVNVCPPPPTPQALLRERQKREELEKTKEVIKQLIQEAAVRTRKEVGHLSAGGES